LKAVEGGKKKSKGKLKEATEKSEEKIEEAVQGSKCSSKSTVPSDKISANNGKQTADNGKQSADDIKNKLIKEDKDNNEKSLNLMAKFLKSTDDSVKINNFATTALKVSAQLLKAKLNKEQSANQEQVLKVLQAIRAPEKFCPFKEQIACDPNFPYRSLDGSCNNLKNPWWGKAGTPFKRWMSADYSDDFKLNDPRAASDGSELPNARLLSCALGGDFHDIEKSVTHMLMQWGQLVNHDITSLSITLDDDPDQSICKTCTKTHKCLPIMIESNTTCNCVKTMLHNCIEFTRSSASFGDVECTLGPREQINLQTAFLDGSHIYGATPSEMEQVRDRINNAGLLKVQRRSNNAKQFITTGNS